MTLDYNILVMGKEVPFIDLFVITRKLQNVIADMGLLGQGLLRFTEVPLFRISLVSDKGHSTRQS